MSNKNFKRRKYIVSKKFQFKYALGLSMIVIIAALVIVGSIYYLEHFTDSMPLLGKTVVWFIIIVFGAGIGGIYISHKIVGPIFRLEMMIDRIIDGDYDSTITIREGDELYKLNCRLNLLVEKLKEDRLVRRKELEAIIKKLKEGEVNDALADLEKITP